MKILILCRKLPFDIAFSFRIANSIRYLSKKYRHNITLISFKYLKDGQKDGSNSYDEYLKEYCDEIKIEIHASLFKRMVEHIITIFSGDLRNILDFTYSRKIRIKINELLEKEKFDVIFVDIPYLLFYVSDVNLPKVLEIWTIPKFYYEAYKLEKKNHKKLLRLLIYFREKNYEKYYKKFNACITPAEGERDILKSYLQNLEISVIPYGINIEPTNKTFIEDFPEDFPSLLFIGNIGDSPHNQRSILYFYDKIYPVIKETFPEVKLYIVGKNPTKEIIQLTRDKSVIVTGYVEDLRPYLARASVITLPVHGYGIKTRILESMAMGKPIVTSSAGIQGINVTAEENIIIADEPEEFAKRVVELLNDEEMRNRIGTNARKLMEEEYSWEKMTDKLNDVFQKVARK